MSRPRPSYRKRVLQIGRRTMGQFFRLVPSEELNQTIGYLLARYLNKYGIELHTCVFMGNHYHLLVSVDEPTLDLFLRDFNSQLARYLNARTAIKHVKVWAPVEPAAIECLDPGSAWDDIIYIALNPVKALIVSRPEAHPGLIILPRHWGTEISFEPPNSFFKFAMRGEGVETITPCPPPGFEDTPLEVLKKRATHKIEMEARRFRRTGVKFYGFEDVGIWDCPRSLWARRTGTVVHRFFPSSRFDFTSDLLFDSCPRYQATDKSLLRRAHEADRSFQTRYDACRDAEKDGETDITYPEGSTAQRNRNPNRVEPLVDRGWYPLLNYF